MTATELADRLEKWLVGTSDLDDLRAAVRELRRIPELERRALDDEEIAIVCRIRDHWPAATAELAPLVARLRPPKPLLDWQDHGNGVWTAQHGGATYSVSPIPDNAFWVGEWANRSIGNTATADTIDAAKATAEKWAGGR